MFHLVGLVVLYHYMLYHVLYVYYIGLQIECGVVHLRTSLVQLFVLLHLNFEKVV
jgi:hypothetical protein